MDIRIAPSILAGDFANLASELRKAEAAGADLVHVDVMDGHFVENITLGPPVVQALRRRTSLPLDVHLMIEDPEKYAPAFLDAGADVLSFHLETMAFPAARRKLEKGYTVALLDDRLIDLERLNRLLDLIRSKKKKAAVALNPDTMVEVMETLPERLDMVLIMTVWPGFGGQEFIASCADKAGKLRRAYPKLDIEVDGGINPSTVEVAARAGANVIVAGTATYRAPDFGTAVRELRERARKAAAG